MLASDSAEIEQAFMRLAAQEKESIKTYIRNNRHILADRYNLTLTPSRLDILARFYVNHILDIGQAFQQIRSRYDGH